METLFAAGKLRVVPGGGETAALSYTMKEMKNLLTADIGDVGYFAFPLMRQDVEGLKSFPTVNVGLEEFCCKRDETEEWLAKNTGTRKTTGCRRRPTRNGGPQSAPRNAPIRNEPGHRKKKPELRCAGRGRRRFWPGTTGRLPRFATRRRPFAAPYEQD